MLSSNTSQIDRRLNSLEKHLQDENPVLLKVVQSFRELDGVAYRMGLLTRDESYATRVPWWPLISILGTFSSGKSTFINDHLGLQLQRTGNQAVDDKFTVICFSNEDQVHTLPGLALDADPRFPFYQISQDIEQVVSGEGRRIDAYLQLKTCPSEKLRGKIMIDSPGFDADDQRNATLKVTDHIMDLSDLVLVFFDARHPEPGAMRDTLQHLVANTINRHDSNKFLFVLNQIDCTVREDNLEDVTAAWQRALAQAGLTAGRFYQIYNLQCAHPIEDKSTEARFQAKRAEDMEEILERIQRVEVERAYRIIGVLENTAKLIEEEAVPRLREMIAHWRKNVLITDGILVAILAVGLGVGLSSVSGALEWLTSLFGLNWTGAGGWGLDHALGLGALALVILVLTGLHMGVRKMTARVTLRRMIGKVRQEMRESVSKAFERNTRPLRSLLNGSPAGWTTSNRGKLAAVLGYADKYVQDLNDRFTNPSGKAGATNPPAGREASHIPEGD